MSARLTAKVYSLLLLSLVSFACNNQQNGQQHQHKDTISPVPRDTSVTKLNSYVDFFLDSAQLASYLRTEPLADSLRQSILNFYKERNYEFAWLGSDGITDHARGFWNLYLQSPFSRMKTSNDTLIDAVIEQAEQESMDSFSGIDSLRKLELALTTRFFVYSEKIYGSHTDPRQLEWHIPERKFNVSSLLHQFLSTEPTAWFPVSHTFSALRTGLRTYREVQRGGGWGKIAWPAHPNNPQAKAHLIRELKQRLSLTNNYPASDSSSIMTDSFKTALKLAADQFGLAASEDISKDLVDMLNVGVEERIKQIIVNLERMKWMPELPIFFIQVNIPSYQLRVVDANKTVLSMKVIVGKTAHKTIIFSDTLKYIVFNPYWNIPSSIIKHEILPAMKKNASYLRRHNMEIIGSSGGYPIIRQRPGDNNALGRIKFLFPNRYNIYLHDTPSKELFGNNKRSFSHGCIRLRQPFALAKLLLTTGNRLSPQAFDSLQESNKEQWITLTKPCPVFITYFTSWADENGIIHFISDIYGHDKKLASHLFK